MRWLDEAVVTGTATTPGHPVRIAVLDAVRADRAGPAAARLLRLTRSADPHVRHRALDLLLSLAHGAAWPRAADAALARLTDPDEGVRRLAAGLLVQAGRRDLALRELTGSTDPVVRTATADALGGAVVAGLGDDPLGAVRFLAHLEALRTAPPAQWPALDAALLADAERAALQLPGLGARWGWALYTREREQHTYDLAKVLLAAPATRDLGAALARTACHAWRSAPVELVPALLRHGAGTLGPAVAKALRTASISAEALRVHGAAFTALPGFTPYPISGRPPGGLPGPAYDATSAAAVLDARPVGVDRLARAPELFGPLLDEGPLTFRQAAQLYNLTFKRPSRMQAVCAPLWLRHAGPAALPRLLALITPYLTDYGIGAYYLEGLARMGPRALPALPAVTALIDRSTRIPVNDSTHDGEMALDEALLRAALQARDAIGNERDGPHGQQGAASNRQRATGDRSGEQG
ncbi:hypothetical protein [Streptomyces sp. G-G2]|uniref:hypothetical protein n=1 Tax=Streptomyces sp. G-G2 TaxID=3046201 RepID=UPI0024BB7D5B|nr:hypothetical protein [Streptomyces sp. G-G2]MDJ0382015.1 hypothetical protein [Streptomyces sp. G-G2]